MFSFFKKNTYLIDYISGITDFHNHLLPGIDDGAKNLEESSLLIEGFHSVGIDQLIATPHVMGEFYPNTPSTIKKSFDEVKNSGNLYGHLGYSAEYMMDQNFIEIIENNNIIPIVNKHVLVEMSYFQPPLNLNQILFKLQNNSYQPILAHPERYNYLHSKSLEKYKDLKSRGCKFQLNMLSLSTHYGLGIQKMAFKLIEADMIDFICSDAHKIEHLDKIKDIKVHPKHENYIQQMVIGNRELFQS